MKTFNKMRIIDFKMDKNLFLVFILIVSFIIGINSFVLAMGKRPKEVKPLKEEESVSQTPDVEPDSESVGLYLFLILNQKCPDYFQDFSMEGINPWVRLYSTRYLYPWAKELENCPQNFHCILHLDSLLIKGIEELVAGEKEDIYLTLSKKPVIDLTEEDKDFIFKYFFYIPRQVNDDFYSRYKELKSLPRDRYTNQDFLDLEVLFALSWLDPQLQKEYFSRYFKGKNRSFTEKEKMNVFEKQMELVRKVIPLLKALQDKKQIEIMCTPYHEIILPLIHDSNLARVSDTEIKFPTENFSYPEDVQSQLAKGLITYETSFGSYPMGLWLPEGAIAEELFVFFSTFGIKWIFLEEDILRESLEEENLYHSCFFEKEKDITIFPLHRGISRKINNIYFLQGAEKASRKLVSELFRIRKKFKKFQRQPEIVTLNLEVDSDFIFKLDEVFSEYPELVTTTYPKWFANYPYSRQLDNIKCDSEKGGFSAWIGKERQNRAWNNLVYAREAIGKYKNSGEARIKRLDAAFEKIYTAQEARWFFCFGQDNEKIDLDKVEQEYNDLLADIYKDIRYKVPNYLLVPSTDTVNVVDTDLILKVHDPLGDDNGGGDYLYPLNDVFVPGIFDLEEFSVRKKEKYFVFSIKLNKLDNPWQLPLGMSFPIVDIYIDLNNIPRAGSTFLLPQRNAYTMPKDAWEYCVTINGETQEIYKAVINSDPVKVSDVKVKINFEENIINAYIPKNFLRGNPKNWGFIPLVLNYDNESTDKRWKVSKVKKEATQWNFGGGFYEEKNPNIIDVILPQGKKQKKILGVYKKKQAVQIPALRCN